MANPKNVLRQVAAPKLSKKNPIEDPLIRITGIKPNSDDLIMNDNGETITFPDNTVTWEIRTPDVSEIYLIVPDHSPSTVFRVKPNKRNPQKIWNGKTKYRSNLPHNPIAEKYTIIYKRKAPDDKLYYYDPIIQVNP